MTSSAWASWLAAVRTASTVEVAARGSWGGFCGESAGVVTGGLHSDVAERALLELALGLRERVLRGIFSEKSNDDGSSSYWGRELSVCGLCCVCWCGKCGASVQVWRKCGKVLRFGGTEKLRF